MVSPSVPPVPHPPVAPPPAPPAARNPYAAPPVPSPGTPTRPTPAPWPSPPAAARPDVRPLGAAERALAPDLARGLMLLLIAVANVEFYLYGRTLDEHGSLAGSSTPDRWAHAVEQLLAAERSRPMFAILYGFGLAVMASRMHARGLPVDAARGVLARRSLWLVALGVLHAVLLFAGDILAPYGATGLVVLALVHQRTAVVRAWLIGTGVYVAVVTTGVMALLGSGAFGDPTAASTDHPLGMTWGAAALGGLGLSLAQLVLAVALLAFVPLALAGVLVQRAGWLERPGEHRTALRRVAWSGLAVNVASSTPVALIALGAWAPGTAAGVAASYLTVLGGLYAGLGYVCAFALLAHRLRRTGVVAVVAALGARSLTGYLLQSVLLAPLLLPWGLGLGAGLGYAQAYAVAAGAWATTVVVAAVLERAGHRGPFEVLLRRLTYGPPAR